MQINDNDIVISGISGRFPSSDNVKEFAHNLYNKIDMTDDDESRWNHFNDELPRRFGKVRNLEKFDASFFSTLNKHANWTDPQMRILLEHAYESILDAGISPQSLIGSRTGVFIGCSISDARDAFLHRVPPKDGYVVLGSGSFYLANRISYALGLCGPSFVLDTACSSSTYALDCAYRYIETGLCDSAIVGGSQLILSCGSTMEYTRLGILANDGICRPFDENATGFSRAETICVVFLQKRKDSKRIYANLVYSSSNNDGFKKEGASFPSRIMQQKLIEDFYKTIMFDPINVKFVEAHSTGTKLGDPEELAAIDGVFCKNSIRQDKLIIGSVKSNMGHAEAASGMASIAKILLTFENQLFPPNINITAPRSDVPAFSEGRIQVASEPEKLSGEFIAMNSFGLGGGNVHALFRQNLRTKVNQGVPNDNYGRMVLWSGRTEAAINTIFDDITQRPLDAEHIALLQNCQIQTTNSNTYRGYGMFIHDETQGKAVCVKQNIQYFNGTHRKIVFVYSGIGSQWLEMGRDLMKIPIFAKSIENCHNILLSKGIDLKKIITSTDENTFSNVMHSYVGIVAIEIALTDILKELGIIPDHIIGHSVGELGCAYADNCFTAEETILAAHARGKASLESNTIQGAMAAVGMHWKKLEEILPNEIDIACHNGEDSTTISGPVNKINKFFEKLNEDKVFYREVACSGIPLHSRYITEMGQKLHEKLKKIIKEPKMRSSKWLSSTYPEDMWNKEEACFSSAEYHTKNLLSPVLFKEVSKMIPNDALMIEIAPHGLMKSILKRNLKEGIYVNLTQRDSKNQFDFFMEAIGSLFQHGVDMDISKLYPPVSFPVSRGTPMISPVIKWNHEEDHFVPYFDSYNTFERRNIVINISDKKFEFLQGHIVDGRVLFPATGWVYLVWEEFANMIGIHVEKTRVVIEDIHFLRATPFKKNQDVLVTISIHRGTGRFEIIEGNSPICHGKIKQDDDIKMTEIKPHIDEKHTFTEEGFYKEMRLCGIVHLGLFKGVKEMQHDGLRGKLKWMNNWMTFLDTMAHFLSTRVLMSRDMGLPVRIRKFVIDPILHRKILDEKIQQNDHEDEEIIIDVNACPYRQIIQAGGIELHEKTTQVVIRRRPKEPLLEISKFIPFNSQDTLILSDAGKILVQIAIERLSQMKFIAVEIDAQEFNEDELLSPYLSKALNEIPQIISDITLITSRADIQMSGVTISTDELSSLNEVDLVIAKNCMHDEKMIEEMKSVLNNNGYIISRENQEVTEMPNENIQLVAKYQTKSNEFLHLLQFKDESLRFDQFNIIEITPNVVEWLEHLKTSLKESPTIIYAYNQEPSGILGFFNCIRREFSIEKLKCFFMIDTDNSPSTFDINHEFFRSQLQFNYAVNIFKEGKWGNYRFLDIPADNDISQPQTQHCLVNCLIKGDLSTLSWLKGPLDINNSNDDLIKIQYSSLNFKDIMLALGKIPEIFIAGFKQLSILGFEFSGIKQNGERVMGIATKAGALSTHYSADDSILWKVPDSWTLEEAATVPLVYFTVYFAFFNTTTIKAGKKILIHSGSGGVGQAAIEVALAYGLEVFTTVSTEEKKNFLLKRYPKLKAENIGNSRDTTFEKMVLDNTHGKGVDYVLNSLSDEKLHASIRCLGKDGVFLEIGKYDIEKGTNLDMRCFAKRILFKAVIFDDLPKDSEEMRFVYDLVDKDLNSGVIKPLNTTIFDADKIEEAFRFMASGHHMGKVLLKIRHDASDKISLPITTLNQFYCDANESIIIAGGLGGIGIELTEWLASRGCRKFVLSSSRGIRSTYQQLKIKVLESMGINSIVSTADITTEAGCEELIKQALELGPVGAIFNLAGVLRDGIFDNLDEKMFSESLAPKALATKNLDRISRNLCPSLKQFVVFSSMSCGRGNAGQCNYGMANSIMERIIEQRRKDGLPGKSIQWGAIGDVGMLAEFQLNNFDKDIGGTLPQGISSCMESLDVLLTSDDVIVSSMVVAEKRSGDFKKGNIIDIIFKIMGIRDKKSISMDSTLTQLGIDSLTGVEIQQIIEREFDISLTSQELRSFTLNQLQKRILSKGANEIDTKSNESSDNTDDSAEKAEWMKLLLEGVLDPKTGTVFNSESIVKANDIEDTMNIKVLILPGFYGFASKIYQNLGKKLQYPTYILQFLHTSECESIEQVLETLVPNVLDLFSNVDQFILIGHSFGAVLGLKIAKLLEDIGKLGKIIEIDGSPLFSIKFGEKLSHEDNFANVENYISMLLFRFYYPYVDPKVAKTAFENYDNWEERFRKMMEASSDRIPLNYEYLMKHVSAAYINRINIALHLETENFSTLRNSKISLIKAAKASVKEIPNDYGLSQYSPMEIDVRSVEGDHVTVLKNDELSLIIRNLISI